jgi:proline iminopeptidase
LSKANDMEGMRRFAQLMWTSDFADRTKLPDLITHPLYKYPHNAEAARSLGYAAVRRAAEDNFGAELAALATPVLVVHGSDDPVPLAGAQQVAKLLPRSSMVVLAGVGHDPWLEDPDGLRGALREWVAGLLV